MTTAPARPGQQQETDHRRRRQGAALALRFAADRCAETARVLADLNAPPVAARGAARTAADDLREVIRLLDKIAGAQAGPRRK